MPLWYSYMRLDDGGSIKGEAFRHFLDICWPYTDYITLSEGMFEDAPDVEFPCVLKDLLAPWFSGRIVADEWFGYGPGSTKMRIYRYQAADRVKELLLSYYQDIFLRLTCSGIAPEDCLFENLCLFSDGRLFFGSVSHERECGLCPLSNKMYQAVVAVGEWDVCPWRGESSRLSMDDYPWE